MNENNSLPSVFDVRDAFTKELNKKGVVFSDVQVLVEYTVYTYIDDEKERSKICEAEVELHKKMPYISCESVVSTEGNK